MGCNWFWGHANWGEWKVKSQQGELTTWERTCGGCGAVETKSEIVHSWGQWGVCQRELTVVASMEMIRVIEERRCQVCGKADLHAWTIPANG